MERIKIICVENNALKFKSPHFKIEKKDYLNCLRSSGHQSENCRHFSKRYLECRMEKNLMARQDVSELGFEKETDLETSGEKEKKQEDQ
ncbi:hypothetical protein MANES_11G036000v8 [Manihot esculenta]|uniref:CHCH domain-containing protein n=1 Tax=Manihot esculenta TaxID=3983 RepID=A0A2C9UY26_MANES|nr:hypothetical protein MANES_11G036000v8 [Manihot esculenta]